jgi:hypothetical protein
MKEITMGALRDEEGKSSGARKKNEQVGKYKRREDFMDRALSVLFLDYVQRLEKMFVRIAKMLRCDMVFI